MLFRHSQLECLLWIVSLTRVTLTLIFKLCTQVEREAQT